MRIAVTGTTGRVGTALAEHFAREHEVIPLTRTLCDLENPASLADALKPLECDIFLNPAGLTSLEACEDDPALAKRVNTDAPAQIAAWAAPRGIRVVHFSTDYVFDGKDPALKKESDAAFPISIYGRSKRAGEEAILAWPRNSVIRVSWVFGPEKGSFIDQIFHTALAGDPLAAIDDKFSLPTFTTDLAAWTEKLIAKEATGLIHACNSGEPVSWYGMARLVLKEMLAAGMVHALPEIKPLTLDRAPGFRAARPRFTAMDTTHLTKVLGEAPRTWQEALTVYIQERAQLWQREKDR